ncbi:MAG: xanthine dehydrogenase family protein molybdopterin-binding subunit [Hyphomicrobiaceae bacterium]
MTVARPTHTPDFQTRVVGKSIARIDGRSRTTGEARYPADIALPGMLYAKVLRSPHAHGLIRSIDISKARSLPGVHAVITGADFVDVPVGSAIPMGETGYDMWAVSEINMARRKVCWVGQPVAAVAAVDPYTASAACDLIAVDYNILKPAVDLKTAITPDAPVIHDHVFTTGIEGQSRIPSNICSRTVITHGEATEAYIAAVAKSSISVAVDTGHQGYLEPQATVAQVDADGLVTVFASTQGQFTAELMIASILGLPLSKIKVVPMEVGGGFGGKITTHGEPIAAKLSAIARRPVKLVLTREEVLQGGSGPAAGMRVKIDVAAEPKGKISAIRGTFHVDAGGLPGLNPSLLMQAAAALYSCDNLHLEGFDVVTNKPRTEAYRGPGGIQAYFAMEQAMDQLCQELSIDPLAFRKRNAAVTGSRMPIGTPFPPIGLTSILDRVGRHKCWQEPLGVGEWPRGRGLALGYWRGTSMTSACHVTIGGDGCPILTLGAIDISGTRTTMAQVAADQFELSVEDVFVQMGDSKSVGYSDGAAGSRVARTMTAAVVEACDDALAQLRDRAAIALQAVASRVQYRGGVFTIVESGASISLAELMKATLTDGAIVGRGSSTKLPLGVEIGAHVCDVEVDTETGLVKVLRYTAFQDVGRALNPAAVEGQIQGSVVQGLGWALMESIDYNEKGQARNASLLDYRLPTALDVPTIECVILENPVPGVPYGLRGVGEVPIVPVGGCVANAIARAIGVRVTKMPMTPERVLDALAQRI